MTALRPILVVVVLGLAFFAPLVVHPGQVLYSDHSDMLTESIPARRFLVRSWQQTGELPLWCPFSYGGMPFLHDVKVAAFYPPHLPLYLLPEDSLGPAMSWLVVFHVLVAGVGMYLYARSQHLTAPAAVVGALGFMFAGKWMLHLLAGGHYFLTPLAWLPLVLLGLDLAIRRSSLLAATGAGVAFALIVLGGHPQATLYAGLFTGLWSLGPALEQAGWFGGSGPRSWRRTGLALARWIGFGLWTAGLAAALAAVELLPAIEAMGEATRGAGVPSGASVPLTVLMLLELTGASLTGPHWEAGGGLTVLWLSAAILAPSLLGGRVRFQALVAVLLLAFALGGGAALQLLPGLSLFQIHNRILLFLPVPMALLAGTTTQAMLAAEPPGMLTRRGRRVLLGVVAVVLLTAGIRLLLAKPAELRPPVYWLSLLVTVPLALWLLGRLPRDTRAGTASASGLLWIGILLVDLWAFALPLVVVRPETEVHEPSASVRFLIEHRAEHGRILDRGLADADPSVSPLDPALPLLFDLESLRGYNSVDVRRYKEYLQFITGDERPLRPREGPFGFPILANFRIENKPLLDLLGTRYLLQPSRRPRRLMEAAGEVEHDASWEKAFEEAHPRAYQVIAGGVQELPPFIVYENRAAFPRAFVVPEAEPLPDRQHVLAALKNTDFRHRVLLEGIAAKKGEGLFRPAVIQEYRPNRVVVEVDGEAGGFLVLADVWFPGWTATVDGQPVPIYRANYLFRAVELPAGAREVMFRFAPVSYSRGQWISLAALVIAAGIAVASVLWDAFRRGKLFPSHP